jgi:N-acetylmuramoyl-L-alanine amidase
MSDLNSASIGIELDNTGEEPFAEAQIVTLLSLLADLRERYKIPAANVLAHGDVAPTRKVDPSRFFPWRRLAQAGFGAWCDTPPAAAPAGFDAALGLRALGYDTTVAAAARAAFRRHFLADEGNQEFSASEQALLHCLLSQSRALLPPTASGSE